MKQQQWVALLAYVEDPLGVEKLEDISNRLIIWEIEYIKLLDVHDGMKGEGHERFVCRSWWREWTPCILNKFEGCERDLLWSLVRPCSRLILAFLPIWDASE